MFRLSKRKYAFTLIELMIVVAIIGLLAVIALGGWASSAQKKAAISSYKSSMQSVRAAVELCGGPDSGASSGNAGDSICGKSEKYPVLSSKCGNGTPTFAINGSGDSWQITTTIGASGWDCRGCRLICDVVGCQEVGACS